MSDRSALFDVRTSTSVSLDQVVRRDTVEIPSEAPLAMPVQPLSFWQGGARRATALIQDMTLRRWMLGLMVFHVTLLGALFPACSSVAEVLWSPAELTAAGPTAGTYERMLDHRCRLVARGIPASVPANGPGVGWSVISGQTAWSVSTRSARPASRIGRTESVSTGPAISAFGSSRQCSHSERAIR